MQAVAGREGRDTPRRGVQGGRLGVECYRARIDRAGRLAPTGRDHAPGIGAGNRLRMRADGRGPVHDGGPHPGLPVQLARRGGPEVRRLRRGRPRGRPFPRGRADEVHHPGPPGSLCGACRATRQSEGLAEHPLAWAKFVREADEPPQGGFAAHVREVGVDEADLFAATVVAGFGMPPPIARWVREIVGLPGWRCFLSELDGSPVGGGALFVRGDFAWLGIGATKPEARKRGSQSALIARRISAARRDGARWIVTETGVPQPGQPAQSYKNILAAGFKVAYVRPNWSPA